MTQKLISMTEKELSRINVIQNLIDGKINGTDASKQIGISIRHIRRLKLRVGKYGTEGLIHKSRGRTSNRKLDSEIVKKVEQHLKEKYYDFGPTLASEKLEEDDNIKLDKETLRGIMTRMGLWKPKPRKQAKKKHFWRPRKDNFGEMEQFDGSYHIWFGDEESCLLLSVDDATGKITHAKFDYNESVIAVFKFWIEYFEKNGLPISIYLDKFSTYKVNHKNAVDNKDMITQFERAINQIGVKPITAHSPEAKGRVERMNKTLQDRLIKELRLANISTMEQANEFLKEYVPKLNAKFSVVPNRRADLHKPLNKTIRARLPQIFSIQDKRKVMNDYTIRFEKQYFQLKQEQPTTVYKKDTVTVERRLNGEIKINLKGHYLNYTELPERPKKEINVKLAALTNRKPSQWKPPENHPWRNQFLWNKIKNDQPVLIEK
ncbi:ISNCY family transposase [Patescibacteria group bacterium]|nr:ISNCY family transposase [Patescibacteria group bacterium]